MLASKCCKSTMTVSGRVTHFYICDKCKRNCDFVNLCERCDKEIPEKMEWKYISGQLVCEHCLNKYE